MHSKNLSIAENEVKPISIEWTIREEVCSIGMLGRSFGNIHLRIQHCDIKKLNLYSGV